MSKVLWTLRENRELSADLWQRFKEKAARSGNSPTAALARLIRRYIDHGFDNGEAETVDDK